MASTAALMRCPWEHTILRAEPRIYVTLPQAKETWLRQCVRVLFFQQGYGPVESVWQSQTSREVTELLVHLPVLSKLSVPIDQLPWPDSPASFKALSHKAKYVNWHHLLYHPIILDLCHDFHFLLHCFLGRIHRTVKTGRAKTKLYWPTPCSLSSHNIALWCSGNRLQQRLTPDRFLLKTRGYKRVERIFSLICLCDSVHPFIFNTDSDKLLLIFFSIFGINRNWSLSSPAGLDVALFQ